MGFDGRAGSDGYGDYSGFNDSDGCNDYGDYSAFNDYPDCDGRGGRAGRREAGRPGEIDRNS